MGKKIVDITGKRFGRLTVTKGKYYKYLKNGCRNCYVRCLCDCGAVKYIKKGHITDGAIKSCGCLSVELFKERSSTHGLIDTKLYIIWNLMKQRTTNKNRKNYKYYGKRGIIVCAAWFGSFPEFNRWALENGYKEGLEIDRINNSGNYEPSNCRFVTHRENILNQRLLSSRNTSGYRGVSFDKRRNKWLVSICIKGEVCRLGSYHTKEEAAQARNQYIIDNNLEHEYKLQEIK